MPELPYYLKKGMPRGGPQQNQEEERWPFQVEDCWHKPHTVMKEPLKHYGSKSGQICLCQLCGSRWLRESKDSWWVEVDPKKAPKEKRSTPLGTSKSASNVKEEQDPEPTSPLKHPKLKTRLPKLKREPVEDGVVESTTHSSGDVAADYESARNNVEELNWQLLEAQVSSASYSHSPQWQEHVLGRQSELRFWQDYVHSLELKHQSQGTSWVPMTERSTASNDGEIQDEYDQNWNWDKEQWETEPWEEDNFTLQDMEEEQEDF